MTPLIESARYIVFLIDSKIKDHDGKVFCSYSEAKEWCNDMMDGVYADRAVIGMFVLEPNAREMGITMVETIGFKSDKKRVSQLDLFRH